MSRIIIFYLLITRDNKRENKPVAINKDSEKTYLTAIWHVREYLISCAIASHYFPCQMTAWQIENVNDIHERSVPKST